MKNTRYYNIFDGVKIPSAVYTVNSTTNLCTSAAHGLVNGDIVIVTTATTLIDPLVVATEYYIINATTNTFQFSTSLNGTAVNFADTGTDEQRFWLQGKRIYCADADFVNITTYGNATNNMVVKVLSSSQKDCPAFGGAVSGTNTWIYQDIIGLHNGTSIDGSTGFDPTESTVFINSINADGIDWITMAITAYTAGNVKADATLYDKR